MLATAVRPTKDHYDQIFELECQTSYPLIDMFERNWGYAIDRSKLESAARTLACPLKINPPNWQHGRIIYTIVSEIIRKNRLQHDTLNFIDIGTAKGFSALCMLFAVQDLSAKASITSCDVIDPDAKVRRNTVAEVDGLKTLRELLAPWPGTEVIKFHQLAGATMLAQSKDRVHFAFVDGKHNYTHVHSEAEILKRRQQSGDITLFDDAQVPGVQKAVEELTGYEKDYLSVNAHRKYCIATRL